MKTIKIIIPSFSLTPFRLGVLLLTGRRDNIIVPVQGGRMITTKTVLVLGAGASYPYEFPLGRNLLIEACNGLAEHDSVFDMIIGLGHWSSRDIDTFRTELEYSQKNSIDEFLENREEYIPLGKWVIAGNLIQKENITSLLQRKDELRWYEYLYRHLGQTLDEFLQNRLSIVTFNYDRSLEYFLFYALKYSYKMQDTDIAEALKSIPIIHVYGQLAKPHFWDNQEGRNYNTDLVQGLHYAAKNIHIISEQRTSSTELEEAVELIVDADRLCFLGFGFIETNIERLKLNGFRGGGKQIYGTVLNFGDAEIERVRKKLKDLTGLDKINLQNMTNLDLLRNLPIL